MKKLIVLFFSLFALISCSQSPFGKKQLSVATWNVQTFFDGKKDGCEYSEFTKGDNWSIEKYEVRLDRLCKVINQLDCDVIVLEELENEGIIYDISNRLAGNAWNQKKNWNYACFAKNPGSSIGCGILSRYELSDLKIHNLDVRTSEKQPSMRPIMEVSINNGKEKTLLFVNHWKSKSGGAEESEIWRDLQENVLCSCINYHAEENPYFIICGDFNRDVQEFKKAEDGGINLRPGNFGKKNAFVNSCWFDEEGNLVPGQGSYYFKDNWERIDHIFTSQNFLLESFEVFSNGEWCTEDGIPKSYKVYTGEGFSDHVPLKAILSYKE